MLSNPLTGECPKTIIALVSKKFLYEVVLDHAPFGYGDLLALLALVRLSNDDGAYHGPIPEIAVMTRQKRKNCRLCLGRLEQQGWITSTKQRGIVGTYQLNMQRLKGLADAKPAE